MKNLKRETKGITLVALVITIIILLILAGIAIASLTGDNGLFARANQARQNTLDAQNKENVTLEGYEDAIDYAVDGVIKISGVNPSITDPEGAMPTGATVIQGNADEGIVIKDEKGNEWVWVEVPKSIYDNAEYYTNGATKPASSEDYTNIEKIMQGYVSVYRDSYTDDWYSQEQHGLTQTKYNNLKKDMLKSVYKYGGFWIGRYEVGDADATERNITRTDITGTSNIAVIKANQIPYTYVTCRQAQELATGLSTGGKASSLMFGIQWDLTCKFLEVKEELAQEQIKTDSKEWGNYSNSTILLSQGKYNSNPNSLDSQWLDITQGAKNGVMLLTTGASEDAKKMNIFDFAGNVWEWTLETYTSINSYPCAFRGGYYEYPGSYYPASRRGYGTTLSNYDIGFRSSLF